jgi:hypothetical protein
VFTAVLKDTAHVIGAVLDTLTVHTGNKVLLTYHVFSMTYKLRSQHELKYYKIDKVFYMASFFNNLLPVHEPKHVAQ